MLGHLENSKLRKLYFTNLAVRCVSEVNAVIDHNGIALVRNLSYGAVSHCCWKDTALLFLRSSRSLALTWLPKGVSLICR